MLVFPVKSLQFANSQKKDEETLQAKLFVRFEDVAEIKVVDCVWGSMPSCLMILPIDIVSFSTPCLVSAFGLCMALAVR